MPNDLFDSEIINEYIESINLKHMRLRKTIFTLSAFATLVVTLAVSCKPKPGENNYCSSPASGCNSVMVAKEFFLFKPGSWWVYEEEYSGVRDSMYVLNYVNGTDYNFLMEIKSSLDDFEYRYWPEYNGQPNDMMCSTTEPIGKKCMNIKCSKGISGSPGVSLGEGRCMFFQYNLKDSIPCYSAPFESNFIRITAIVSSISISGFNFGETVKVNNKRDFQNNLHNTNHYFSKGVGLVKLEFVDITETWNLVNYHIEP